MVRNFARTFASSVCLIALALPAATAQQKPDPSPSAVVEPTLPMIRCFRPCARSSRARRPNSSSTTFRRPITSSIACPMSRSTKRKRPSARFGRTRTSTRVRCAWWCAWAITSRTAITARAQAPPPLRRSTMILSRCGGNYGWQPTKLIKRQATRWR